LLIMDWKLFQIKQSSNASHEAVVYANCFWHISPSNPFSKLLEMLNTALRMI